MAAYMVNLELSHYILAVGLVGLVALLATKHDITAPALVLLLILCITTGGGISGGLDALITTLGDFAGVFIAFMLAATISIYLQSSLGAALFKPLSRLMRSPTLAMLVLGATGFVLSLLLWSPIALPVVAIILLPKALESGLSPTGAVMSLLFAGSLAMSLDPILGIVPSIVGFAANATANTAIPMLLTGFTAILCMILLNRRHFISGEQAPLPKPHVFRPRPLHLCLYRGAQIAASLLLPIVTVCSLLNVSSGLLADWAELLSHNAAMHAYPAAVVFLLMTLSALCGRGGIVGLTLIGALITLLSGTTGLNTSLLLALGQVTGVWFAGCFSKQSVTSISELCGDTSEAMQLSLLPILLGITVTMIYVIILV